MRHVGNKQLHIVGLKGAGAPSAEQLSAVNQYALNELTADEVYVRTMYLAHNAIDRDREVMDAALLADFARTLPGKGLFVRHPTGWDGDSGPGEGRFFEARVLDMSLEEARKLLNEPRLVWPESEQQAKVLEATFYTVRIDENKALLAKMDAGVAGDVSIGFWASDRTAIMDASGERIASRLQAPGEALEASLVWLGAQPGARIHKHHNPEDPTVDPKELKIKQLGEDLAAATTLAEEAEAKAKTAATKAAGFDAIVKAVGNEELDAKTIGQLAADGLKYRATLVEEIIKAKRHMGLIGDNDASVNAAKSLYDTWPLEAIKAEAEGLVGKVIKGSQLDGGDPNETGADEHGAKGADPSNPLKNPLVTGKAATA